MGIRVTAQAQFAVTAGSRMASRTRPGRVFRVCWGRSFQMWLSGAMRTALGPLRQLPTMPEPSKASTGLRTAAPPR